MWPGWNQTEAVLLIHLSAWVSVQKRFSLSVVCYRADGQAHSPPAPLSRSRWSWRLIICNSTPVFLGLQKLFTGLTGALAGHAALPICSLSYVEYTALIRQWDRIFPSHSENKRELGWALLSHSQKALYFMNECETSSDWLSWRSSACLFTTNQRKLWGWFTNPRVQNLMQFCVDTRFLSTLKGVVKASMLTNPQSVWLG